jgi:3'-phosphoadenosine 5'-phosphosulfate sulfotransferase (PAPS reductase)/FAD synthetase
MEAKIISFSGGRSSGMMLKIMQDNGMIDANTHVIFANTGKEHEETLKFVDECSKRWDIQVVWLEYIDTAPFYKVVTFQTAARNGEPFEAILRKRKNKYLPNVAQRICTGDMKVKTIHRYVKNTLKTKQYLTYLGIRADEPRRIAKMRENTEMPLV